MPIYRVLLKEDSPPKIVLQKPCLGAGAGTGAKNNLPAAKHADMSHTGWYSDTSGKTKKYKIFKIAPII